MQIRTVTIVLTAVVATAWSSATALAASDGRSVADALVAAMAARGDAQVSYASVEDGDTIVITDLKSVESGRDDRVLHLPLVRLSGVSERPDGGYSAATVSFDNGSISDAGRKITWTNGVMSDVTIPSAGEIADIARIRPFGDLSMDGINVIRTGGKVVATVDAIEANVGTVVEGVASTVAVDATGIWISADMMRGGRRRAMLAALGYTEFRMDFALESSVDFFADAWHMKSLVAQIDEIGEIRMDAKLSGVSLGGLAVSSQRGAASEAARLDSMTIRFDNRGLVERALDMQASMMGVERSAFVEQFIGAVPFMLNFIGNPPFQAKLAVVVANFLREPLSITVVTEPETPVPFEDILRTLLTDRSALPDLLAVDVSAND